MGNVKTFIFLLALATAVATEFELKIAKRSDDLPALQVVVQQLSETVSALQAKVTSQEAKVTSQDAHIHQLETEIQTLKSKQQNYVNLNNVA
jgi:peptidoglycan hydrolase CwlO-like protein